MDTASNSFKAMVGTLSLMISLALGCSSSDPDKLKELRESVDSLQTQVDSLEKLLSKALKTSCTSKNLVQEVREQAEATRQALTDASGARLPASVADELLRLEMQIESMDDWPASAAEAEQMRQELADLIRSLNPQAQDRHLSRILPVEWAVRAIWALRQAADAEPSELERVAEDYQSLRQVAPDGVSQTVITALERELEEVQAAVDDYLRSMAVAKAKAALAGEAQHQEAWEMLSNLPGEDKAIGALQNQVAARLVEEQIAEQVVGLRTRLGRVETLDDEVSNRSALGQLYELAIGYKTDLVLNNESVPAGIVQLDRLIEDLQDQIRSHEEFRQEQTRQQSRRYQQWALAQIDAFNSWYYDNSLKKVRATFHKMKDATKPLKWKMLEEFPSTRTQLADKVQAQLSDGALSLSEQRKIYDSVSGLTGWNYDDELAYRVTRDAMIKYLLPIDERFLDKPVLQLYNRAFASGWGKLEGRSDQLYVAKQAAVTEKQGLDHFRGKDR